MRRTIVVNESAGELVTQIIASPTLTEQTDKQLGDMTVLTEIKQTEPPPRKRDKNFAYNTTTQTNIPNYTFQKSKIGGAQYDLQHMLH